MPSRPGKQSYSGTYFVQDQKIEEELRRIADQDHLITRSMGGVMPEQANARAFQRVLDIACGAGGWAIEAAQTYPEISVVGIDINQRMIEYARAQATAQQIDDRVEFHIMDVLRVLDFPDASFDMVNLRFAISFVRTWDWPRVLNELLRVLRPGGVVRLTDEEVIHESTSPGAMQFCEMLLCALFRSGHLFAQESDGLTAHLAPLLSGYGFQQVQTRAYPLQYRAGTHDGQLYIEDGMYVMQTLRPFVQKWGCISKDYDAIHQQTLDELHRPDFRATWHLLTAWGHRPESEAEEPSMGAITI
jgi:ubiquinone/menaquinone biosynthesis C-methylase UbiE